jgi:signal transduction histidine kinase/ActR/RegA family two-component response regulator
MVSFEAPRVEALLATLEQMAGGDKGRTLPLSPRGDQLDAIAHAVNVLADELRWTYARMTEAERRVAEDLRRSRDEAQRANEAKSVFLRTASHEIRTPIAAILGIADLLALGGVSDDDRADLVERLRANSRALLSLVGNVLDLSRLDADKLAFASEPVAPVELLREVANSFESETRRKRLELRVESEMPEATMIETDRLRLRQILVNLIGNAVKFTSSGGLRLAVRMAGGTESSQLTIDVADTGIGIPADQRRFLFVPFGQADASIVRLHGGSGLGLALSRGLAEQLGGTLTLLHTEPGVGSTFRLTLSVRLVESSRPGALRAADRGSPPAALAGVRILLAEDNADLRLAIGRSLRADGATIDYAGNGREAVTMARSGAFDIVLMDVLMPEMNGLDATRALRGEGNQVAIIALSADAAPEMRTASIVAGCSTYLCKPFDPRDLVAAIRFLLRDEHESTASRRA